MTRRIPLADRYPRAAGEFIENLTRPGVGPDLLALQAKDRCRWLCEEHGVEWVAAVATRTQRSRLAGCPECARARLAQARTASVAPGRDIATLRPDVAAEFVENQTRPGRGPDKLRATSRDLVTWRCGQCQSEYALTVNARMKRQGARCSTCNLGGVRLLEIQVAALVAAQCSVDVLTGQNVDGCRPDLWIPCLDAGLDLDPEWSHRHRLGGDQRKVVRAQARMTKFWRVRENGLPPASDQDVWVRAGAGVDEWAEAVVRALAPLVSARTLTQQERLVALHMAAERWVSGQDGAFPVPFAEVRPDLAARFVENLTRPGVGPQHFAPQSNYLCRWRCPHGVTYEAKAQKVLRQRGTSRCPECQKVVREMSSARMSAANRSRRARAARQSAVTA